MRDGGLVVHTDHSELTQPFSLVTLAFVMTSAHCRISGGDEVSAVCDQRTDMELFLLLLGFLFVLGLVFLPTHGRAYNVSS